MEFLHKPIMVEECLRLLAPERGGWFADGTLGGGGHAEAVLTHAQDVRLLGIDRDAEAISAARKRLEPFGERFAAVRGNFFEIERILEENRIAGLDGMLIDLGVSSYQLDNAARGFSYNEDAPLDMRMDTSAGFSAYDVVNGYDEKTLARMISEYGEENWASRIASFIAAARQKGAIKTTYELVDLIKAAIPAAARREGPHPAKRTFQAIRIEVNGELKGLGKAIEDIASCLNTGGRLAVITFHSLEDRIAKQTFNRLHKPCTCPPKSPICICGKTATVNVLTRKPIYPSEEEIENNPRARSAKLRGIEKI